MSNAHESSVDICSPLVEPSEYAEEVFELMKENGIKQMNHAPLLERIVKMDLLLSHDRDKFLQSINVANVLIGVHVDIKVVREKDQTLPHRVQLSHQVCEIVQNELETTFSSSSKKSPNLLLCVRIVLLSDGSSSGRRYTSSHGKTKLSLAYCLQDGITGHVGLANQLYSVEDCSKVDMDNYWEYSSAVVRSMARQLTQTIAAEVSGELSAWQLQYKTKKERLEQIEAKLAKEEFLEQDEYAFASQNLAL